ncbi:hypothetical protein AB1Y20_000882 [Prymnesium parvum]|uniref:SLC26A/SulP transporter domain-containing protein n=1 Tax=Prymnesium parvum TaxID=97485 RepID=A0AB34K7Y0_PRYPA
MAAYQRLEPPALLPRELVRNLPRELLGGLLSSLILVVLNVVCANVIFHDGYELSDLLGKGVTLAMLCTATGPLLLLLLSDLPLISVSDSFMSALYADMAAHILERDLPSPRGTLFVAMAMCTALGGGSYLVLGMARLGQIVKFVPAPIMSGYLASIGYVQLHSASRMVTGCGVLDVHCLRASPALSQLASAFALGLALYVVRKSTRGLVQTLLIPFAVVGATLGFQLLRLTRWAGHLEALTFDLPRGASVFTLLDGMELGQASYDVAFSEAAATTLLSILPNVIGRLLTYSSLQTTLDREIDYDREMRYLGASNVVGAPFMLTSNVSITGMLVARAVGARSRLPSLVVIVVHLALAFLGADVVSLVPKPIFAALLCQVALGFLVDQLHDAAQKLPWFDFVVIVTHIAFTATLGMAYAVGLGLLLTTFIFIVEYSQHSGVLQCGTLLLEHSQVHRTDDELRVLSEVGMSALVVHLHGVLFFGSAGSCLDKARAHVHTLDEAGMPLRCLLIDFQRCDGLDSSAAAILCQTDRLAPNAHLVFACANAKVLKMLRAWKQDFKHFTSMDLALEYCEYILLSEYAVETASGMKPELSIFSAQAPLDASLPTETKAPWRAAVGLPPPLSRDSSPYVGVVPSAAPAGAAAPPRGNWGEMAHWLTPEQARVKLKPQLLDRMRERFSHSVESRFGVTGLQELVHQMDVVFMPPSSTVIDHRVPLAHRPPPKIYFIDSGYVSLRIELNNTVFRANDAGGEAVIQSRLAKVGPGAIFGISDLVVASALPSVHQMLDLPTIATSSTYVQMLVLPASRLEALQESAPALASRVLQLLLIVQHQSLREYVLQSVASDAFHVPVNPSHSFQQLLLGTPPVEAPADGAAAPACASGFASRAGSESPGGGGLAHNTPKGTPVHLASKGGEATLRASLFDFQTALQQQQPFKKWSASSKSKSVSQRKGQ